MSGKLDQSLDAIVSDRRKSTRGRATTRGRRVGGRTAPTGGVSKTTKSANKPTSTKASTAAASGSDTKIIVSNLPADVNEAQIKEYFGKQIGHTRSVLIQYGPNGASRGIATVVFAKPGMANKAAVELNGLLVDKRPMKIELIVNSARVEPAKTMGDRITKAKNAPKSAAADKKSETKKADASEGTGRAGRGRGRGGRRGGRVGRPKAKSEQELDAEMTDYFGTSAPSGEAATNGAAPAVAAAGEDAGMDEVS